MTTIKTATGYQNINAILKKNGSDSVETYKTRGRQNTQKLAQNILTPAPLRPGRNPELDYKNRVVPERLILDKTWNIPEKKGVTWINPGIDEHGINKRLGISRFTRPPVSTLKSEELVEFRTARPIGAERTEGDFQTEVPGKKEWARSELWADKIDVIVCSKDKKCYLNKNDLHKWYVNDKKDIQEENELIEAAAAVDNPPAVGDKK